VLQEAIALDTGFAMAYRKLAVAIGNSSTAPTAGAGSEEVRAATNAFTRRDRLPDVERGLATAYYYGVVEETRPRRRQRTDLYSRSTLTTISRSTISRW